MYVLVYITTPNSREAKRIGEELVRKRLAVCANIIDSIMSIYWWNKKLQKDREAVLLLKTKKEKVKKIISTVRKMHSYENPAIFALPMLEGSKSYLKWIEDEVK